MADGGRRGLDGARCPGGGARGGEPQLATTPWPWRSGASARGGLRRLAWPRSSTCAPASSSTRASEMIAEKLRGRKLRDDVTQTPLAVVSLAMLPRNERGRTAAAPPARSTRVPPSSGPWSRPRPGQAVVRLGWEANAARPSTPGGSTSRRTIAAYVACFRSLATALKSAAPSLKDRVDQRRSGASARLRAFAGLPGQRRRRHHGRPPVRQRPPQGTQAISNCCTTSRGTVHGAAPGGWPPGSRRPRPGARSWRSRNGACGPTPKPRRRTTRVYIENMYRFFRGQRGEHRLRELLQQAERSQYYPSRQFPRGRAEYRSLWSPDR